MRLLAAASALLLAGCVASGVQVHGDQLADFEPGTTTRADVVAALGQPTTQMRNADGSTTLVYSYVQASARPETYIPFVGAFIGGADSRSNMVTLRFDSDGKLIDHTSSESATGTGMGFRAGQTERVPDQPIKR